MKELHFLVVDDSVIQRGITARVLRELGASHVQEAAGGREALQQLKSAAPAVDVVVMDLRLAGMDGLEFIRHMGAARHSPAVIVTSAAEQALIACVEAMSAAYGVYMLGAVAQPVQGAQLTALLEHYARAAVPSVRAAAAPLLFTSEEIVQGLENGEFEPFFQPKIELSTWRIVGAEALARWRHPQQGLVMPETFIEPLENSGKIHMLLRSIMRQGAQFGRILRQAGHACEISVNLSFESLTDVTLADQIMTVVASQSLAPENIVLEITESAATTEVGRALENLARLRMKGFRLSIDDYGRGVSSIEKLARIPFAELKVDKPLLVRAGRHESARVVFESSLEMARRLGMKSIAEGVESQAEWNLLLDLACDMAQGDFIARPMSRMQYLAWARDWPTQVARRQAM